MNLIQEIEQAEAASIAAKRQLPSFEAGDTVRVHVRVTEGERTRLQTYEGVVIGRRGGGLNESFTVRKISYGEGVERVFPVYSPMVEKVEVVRRGKVRRAKLYYLRGRARQVGAYRRGVERARQEAQRGSARSARGRARRGGGGEGSRSRRGRSERAGRGQGVSFEFRFAFKAALRRRSSFA